MKVLTRALIVVGCLIIGILAGELAPKNSGTIMETVLSVISGGMIGGITGYLIATVEGYLKEKKCLKEREEYMKEYKGRRRNSLRDK